MGELALQIQIGGHRHVFPRPMTILPQAEEGLTVKLKAMQMTRKMNILLFICLVLYEFYILDLQHDPLHWISFLLC